MSTAPLADALAQKAARLERCVARAREELAAATDFRHDQTRQDAAILNVQRACELAIDMDNMVIAHEGWGFPQGAREMFALLGGRAGVADELVATLQRMVGFRNVAVHEYDAPDLTIAERVIRDELDGLKRFASLLLRRYLNTP
ncbi:MAG TPA: DUF86 domain-containing protein [Hydrogenophaga sp.]|uniref:type VII toxin-antitoxin system HepT family RNase toxin n=1 Tax=Hydrogenophaga sp. TaxID=1904254 RepID=UPI002BB37BD8|nr:DUF86 domain-containing protein [Hydrogenophaga sp.]HSX92253.1 DUF86 domain-containing protein [Hydrogenophaga sp.]